MKTNKIDELFTRQNNDVNGNPRYAIHFLDCEPKTWEDYSLTLPERYNRVVKLMNTIGGRKYHCKKYGGGIVFKSYNLTDTWNAIKRTKNTIDMEGKQNDTKS